MAVATPSHAYQRNCPAEANDVLLSTEGCDAGRLKASILQVIGVPASLAEARTHYVEHQIMEVYGTHFRTLLGMRRLLSSLETSKMKPEMMDKHFLMTMDWLKSYGRRADLTAKYSVSKRGFDFWKEQIIWRLVTICYCAPGSIVLDLQKRTVGWVAIGWGPQDHENVMKALVYFSETFNRVVTSAGDCPAPLTSFCHFARPSARHCREACLEH